MQTSLRSSYQYYDYGTLDYSTRGQQNQLQAEDESHLHNLQLPQNHLQQHHPHHNHQLIQDTRYEEQTDCYREAIQSRDEPPGSQDQLYVYSHHTTYQLPDTGQHLTTGIGGGNNNNNNNPDEHAAENHYIIAQTGACQPQEASNYQHVYYEPINFNSTCASENHQHQHLQQQQQAQHQLVEDTAHQAIDATGQLLAVPTFALPVTTQQQSSLITDNSSTTYFQYHQLIEESPVVRQDDSILQLLDHHHQVPFHVQETSQTGVLSAEQPVTNYSGIYQTSDTAELVVQRSQQEQVSYQELDPTNYHGYTSNEVLGEASRQRSSAVSSPSNCSSMDDEDELDDEDDESEASSTLTRDEKRAREANIPLTYYQIVNLTIDKFNEQLAKYNLTESQLTLIKDIRRRGKNKVAAQSCRKRKMEEINKLQHEVTHLSNRRKLLSCECSQLAKEHDRLVQEYNKIYTIIKA